MPIHWVFLFLLDVYEGIHMLRMPLQLSVITHPHFGLVARHMNIFWSPQSTYIVKKSKMVTDIEIITDHFRNIKCLQVQGPDSQMVDKLIIL